MESPTSSPLPAPFSCRHHDINLQVLYLFPPICLTLFFLFFFFFFQAEDGIRDIGVTGVQTCALPISFAMFGGDARHTGRRGGPAPAKQPKELWKVAVGGVVAGSPTIGPDGTI